MTLSELQSISEAIANDAERKLGRRSVEQTIAEIRQRTDDAIAELARRKAAWLAQFDQAVRS